MAKAVENRNARNVRANTRNRKKLVLKPGNIELFSVEFSRSALVNESDETPGLHLSVKGLEDGDSFFGFLEITIAKSSEDGSEVLLDAEVTYYFSAEGWDESYSKKSKESLLREFCRYFIWPRFIVFGGVVLSEAKIELPEFPLEPKVYISDLLKPSDLDAGEYRKSGSD